MESHQEFEQEQKFQRAPSVEALPPQRTQDDTESFEHFYAFIIEQIDQLPKNLQARAKREIILVAEEIYGRILEENRFATPK
uniref:BESS domain-containing protein n=1 Tax=Steinernema glaseri TaxID=37863 RepID=A0A1I7ZIE6_9BILA